MKCAFSLSFFLSPSSGNILPIRTEENETVVGGAVVDALMQRAGFLGISTVRWRWWNTAWDGYVELL